MGLDYLKKSLLFSSGMRMKLEVEEKGGKGMEEIVFMQM